MAFSWIIALFGFAPARPEALTPYQRGEADFHAGAACPFCAGSNQAEAWQQGRQAAADLFSW